MAQMKINYQIAEGTGLKGEPVRQNNWELYIPELSDITLYVNTCSLPAYTLPQTEVHHMNEKSKIAGKPEMGNVTIAVRDVLEPEMQQQIYDWFTKGYDPATGFVGYASEYKKRGYIQQFNSKGGLVRTWRCEGLWITNYTPADTLDYSNGDGALINLELSCDRAFLT